MGYLDKNEKRISWCLVYFSTWTGALSTKLYENDEEFMKQDVSQIACYNGIKIIGLYEISTKVNENHEAIHEYHQLSVPNN